MHRQALRALRNMWWLFLVLYVLILAITMLIQSIGVLLMLLVLPLAFLITSKRLGSLWRTRPAATTLFAMYLAAAAAAALYGFVLSAQPPVLVGAVLVATLYVAPLALAVLVLWELHSDRARQNLAGNERQ